MRLVVQSKATGFVLIPSMDDGGQFEWTNDLKRIGAGVVRDFEHAAQLVEDHTDFEHVPQIVDLDRLGTSEDYK
nr:hypothetical protein [uncultured Rhodoferax sp.]